MTQVDQKPADLGVSGWHAMLSQRRPQPSLESDVTADYVVVGAGFAGLSAALRLAELDPDANIVLLESAEIGQGPAGRNSGFMIDLPHALASGSYAGEDSSDQRQIRMNRSAIAFAAEYARAFNLSEEAFSLSGKINAAATKAGLAHNRNYAEHLTNLGERFESLDRGAMRELSGSDYYLGGLRTPGTVLLQPAMYVRGLADGLLAKPRFRLFENSSVVGFDRSAESWIFKTANGSVTANRAILAVNGLIETFGFYLQRLMHINLYASITRPLTASEIEALGSVKNWGFTPADPIGSSLRRIDGLAGTRLLIRNGCSYQPDLKLPLKQLEKMLPQHLRTLKARYPQFGQLEIEYCWSGRLCLSRNDAWALEELSPGLFSACCQNGLGATRGTIAGIVAAEKACGFDGESRVPDFQHDVGPSKLLPEPMMSIGAKSLIRFKQWKAGKDL